MLRLPPSTITLSAVELQEFCVRQKARLRASQPSRTFETVLRPVQVASENHIQYESSGDYSNNDNRSSHNAMDDTSPDLYESAQSRTSPYRDGEPTGSQMESSREVEAPKSSYSDEDDPMLSSDQSVGQESEADLLPVSHDSTGDFGDHSGEHEQQIRHASYSPSKHRFDYGGFVESHPHDSSSFMPDDISTPVQLTSNDVQRLRTRLPLPRSPLHVSELVAKSPERSHANLAPRVSSYATPSLLLSQPPRRTPKAYRPRTISYSYDESERASAVYEEPTNDSDFDDSQLDPMQLSEPVSLHEELRGSSLHSVSERSEVPSSPPVVVHNLEANRTFYFSSPALPGKLPPPFSTVPRNASVPPAVSRAGRGSDEDGVIVERSPSPPRREEVPEGSQSAPRQSTLNRIGRMFSGRYRNRSPTASSPTTPRQSIERDNSPNHSSPVTPRRSIRVYDDSLPPTSQPQTPANLPEARHRSRLHPSYTAPVTRHRTFNTDVSSPYSEGFRGLYGGQENEDDEL